MNYPLGDKVINVIVRTQRDFAITYIVYFLDELIAEGIITPEQKNQASQYILKCHKENEKKE